MFEIMQDKVLCEYIPGEILVVNDSFNQQKNIYMACRFTKLCNTISCMFQISLHSEQNSLDDVHRLGEKIMLDFCRQHQNETASRYGG
jgi:hypothetical protein